MWNNLPEQTLMQAFCVMKLFPLPSHPPNLNSWHFPVAGSYLHRGKSALQCPRASGSLHITEAFWVSEKRTKLWYTHRMTKILTYLPMSAYHWQDLQSLQRRQKQQRLYDTFSVRLTISLIILNSRVELPVFKATIRASHQVKPQIWGNHQRRHSKNTEQKKYFQKLTTKVKFSTFFERC